MKQCSGVALRGFASRIRNVSRETMREAAFKELYFKNWQTFCVKQAACRNERSFSQEAGWHEAKSGRKTPCVSRETFAPIFRGIHFPLRLAERGRVQGVFLCLGRGRGRDLLLFAPKEAGQATRVLLLRFGEGGEGV